MKFINKKQYLDKLIIYSFILYISCSINDVTAQKNNEKAIEYFQKTAAENKLVDGDLSELIITDQYTSKKSGVEHIYLKQAYKGIEVNRSNSNIHFTKDNEVLIANNRFIDSYKSKINTAIPKLSAIDAIESAAVKAGLSKPKGLKNIEKEEGDNRKGIYNTGGISRSNIPVKLVYQFDEDSNLKLAWDVMIQDINSIESWHFIIDAVSGKILKKIDLLVGSNHTCGQGEKGHYLAGDNKGSVTKQKGNTSNNKVSPPSPAYEVFDLPFENPEESVNGNRAIVTNPADSEASPLGWHLPNNTTTIGNNIDAYIQSSSYRPDGGTDLQFTSFDLNLEVTLEEYQDDMIANGYQDAAVTNAFYIANKVHDILFLHGFDEASGNFQHTNSGTEGYDNDRITVKVQNHEGCSSQFGTYPDGMESQMYLSLCDRDGDSYFSTDDSPYLRDASYSNTTIIHEYAHGLSQRLVGGPADTQPLTNEENLSEGWSDFLAILLTMKITDYSTTPRTFGSWIWDNPNGGRPYSTTELYNVPYTTDFTINSFTYNDIKDLSYVHSIGFVWCTMLWEMTWGLVGVHGFDSDLYRGTGGNNMALELNILAMKLMAADPGFIDGRDALIAADKALYNGENECIIWQAFAKRGLGFGAYQGSSNDKMDGIESFDLPNYCNGICHPILNHSGAIQTSTYQASNAILSTGLIVDNKTVEYNAGNYICLNPNFEAELNIGYYFLAKIEDCGILKENSNTINNSPGKISIINNPNPFSKQTTIEYQLEENLPVTIFITDLTGKNIAAISKNELHSAGKHQVVFDGTNLSAGIYYCTIQAGDHIETQKMVLTK